MKKVKINKRFFGILKIDADVFNEIQQYVETYYDECRVEVKPEYGTYGEPIAISRAYEKICQDCDSIESVKITAQKDENICIIYLNNKKKLHRSTFKLKASVDESMELTTYLFINKIEKMMTKKINVLIDRYFNTIISCGLSLALFWVNKYYDSALIAIGIYLVTAMFIGCFYSLIVSPLIKMIKNDYNWIQFKMRESAEEHLETQKKIKRHNLLSFILATVILVWGTYIISTGS